jgi:hypothetical protein
MKTVVTLWNGTLLLGLHHGLWTIPVLEKDLFIEEIKAEMGAGKALMKIFVKTCMELQCANFLHTALYWNEFSLNVYQQISANYQQNLKIV